MLLWIAACGDVAPVVNDADGDGVMSAVDCDDSDAARGVEVSTYVDSDADGFGGELASACIAPAAALMVGGDCDDEAPEVHPGATERCNGVDDDCDGVVDPDTSVDAGSWQIDYDADGFGAAGYTLKACDSPPGYVADGEEADCDDGDAAVSPDASEVCNGVDDDCDGLIDDADDDRIGAMTWYFDGDGDGFGDESESSEACEGPVGYVAEATDCDDADSAFHPGATEDDCTDASDYNCDGSTGFADLDADGWPACTECADDDPDVRPDALEICNLIDDDCDALTDDADDDVADQTLWYRDADADGWGDESVFSLTCDAPPFYIDELGDCDDTLDSVSPGAEELCNGIDDDCDAAIDDDDDDVVDPPSWFADADEDGFGDGDLAEAFCEAPSGYVSDGTDCDDSTASVLGPDPWYGDGDGDGYGGEDSEASCVALSGSSLVPGDCDDSDAAVFPGADETCNATDDDCDGEIDEDAVDALTWYEDVDGDGFGTSESTAEACTPPSEYASESGDCDDAEPVAYPGHPFDFEDGLDNDCDGSLDEDEGSQTTSHASDIQPIWSADCGPCHTSGGNKGDLALDSGYSAVVSVASSIGMALIEPGAPELSYVWHKLEDTQDGVGGDGAAMPKGAVLSGADVDLIETWIFEGAPE